MTEALPPAALYSLIGEATEQITAMVPGDDDYFGRPGSPKEYTLEYLSPSKLLAALEERFGSAS